MEQRLLELYNETLQELDSIGINTLDIQNIEINISKRDNKRYGACKQLEPDESTRYVEKIGRKKYIKYAQYNKHNIEISPWVMQLDKRIIKNTIMHELIHCMPFCNNHGKKFKEYSQYINSRLGYDISTVRK